MCFCLIQIWMLSLISLLGEISAALVHCKVGLHIFLASESALSWPVISLCPDVYNMVRLLCMACFISFCRHFHGSLVDLLLVKRIAKYQFFHQKEIFIDFNWSPQLFFPKKIIKISISKTSKFSRARFQIVEIVILLWLKYFAINIIVCFHKFCFFFLSYIKKRSIVTWYLLEYNFIFV